MLMPPPVKQLRPALTALVIPPGLAAASGMSRSWRWSPVRSIPWGVPRVRGTREKIEPWRAEPASADLMTVLGSYHLF
jgi:hypothetical protein